MQLSSQDVRRLEKLGYETEDFTTTKGRFRTLKNVHGICYFLDPKTNMCRVYPSRPEGCKYYPIIFSLDKGKPILDKEYCRKAHTVTENEMKKTTSKLRKLIKRIIKESSDANRKAE
jgi:Fe-S-cluster containining protein